MLPALAHETGAKIVVVTLDLDFHAVWADDIVVAPVARIVPEILQPSA
jgi:ABC-type enterochelin transport system ATPase subunit